MNNYLSLKLNFPSTSYYWRGVELLVQFYSYVKSVLAYVPSLPMRFVTPSLREAWFVLTYSLDTWVEKFNAVKRLFEETDIAITAATLKGQKEFRMRDSWKIQLLPFG
jgi:hypothetical protein